jgi:hypothetical protein
MNIVAVIPAHYPEREHWLHKAVASAEGSDRILIVSSYPPQGAVPGSEWKTLEAGDIATGAKYREAVRLTRPGDVLAFLDDDDFWRPGKVDWLRSVFSLPGVKYASHAGDIVGLNGEILIEGGIRPEDPNASTIAISRDLLTAPEIRPFFDRLEWAADTFLSYVPDIVPGERAARSGRSLSAVRYHTSNMSHAPGRYRDFRTWYRKTGGRFRKGWELIDEMLRESNVVDLKVARKIREFQAMEKASRTRIALAYATRRRR